MFDLDARIFHFFHDAFAGSGGGLAAMAVLSAVGGGWGALLVLPLLASTKTRRFARSLALVLASTAVIVFVLKRIVARPRPCVCLSGVSARVFAAPTDFSFPSGHAAGSFAFAVFIAIAIARMPSLDRRWRILGAGAMVAVAFGVGLSRIALGVHFPGDVAAGALVGASAAIVGAHLHGRSSPRPEPVEL